MGTINQSVSKNHAKRWQILAILCVCLLMLAIDVSILYMAMPTIITEIKPNAIQQLWIINAYALTLAGLLITMGAISDRTGRKRMLILGLSIFAASSLLVEVVNNPWTLVICRALLGIGGAMIMPSTLSILRNVFEDERERTIAISAWGVVASIGLALGPIAGGVLVSYFNWQMAFLINVPICLIAILFAVKQIPESKQPSQEKWDWLGVFQSIFGMVFLVQGIKMMSKIGFIHMYSTGLFLAGIVIIFVFVKRQLQLADPLVDFRLFKLRAFSVGIAIFILGTSALASILYLTSQYLQLVKGMTPLQSGIWLIPAIFAGLMASLCVPHLLARYTTRSVIACSLLTIAVGLVLPSLIENDTIVVRIFSLALLEFGATLALSTAAVTIMAVVPAERAGGAAAIQETFYEIGNVIGITIIGSLSAKFYSSSINLPENLSSEKTNLIQDSIGNAKVIVQSLSADLAELIKQAVNSAFIESFNHVNILLSAFMLASAITVLLILKGFKTSQKSH